MGTDYAEGHDRRGENFPEKCLLTLTDDDLGRSPSSRSLVRVPECIACSGVSTGADPSSRTHILLPNDDPVPVRVGSPPRKPQKFSLQSPYSASSRLNDRSLDPRSGERNLRHAPDEGRTDLQHRPLRPGQPRENALLPDEEIQQLNSSF